MLIKSADDKSRRIALLESLLGSPQLNPEQKAWVQREVKNVRYGMQGERDAAHYIDSHFAGAPNHAVIHDLRLEHEGQVAQIDHLVIARSFTFYLLETKNFSGNLQINDFGEFSVHYGVGKAYGIPSPLEQSRRHENVLVKLLEQLGITGRIQKKPDFQHVVLVHPKGTIQRPDAGKYDTSSVIKADQFASWREKHIDKGMSTLQVLGSMLNLRSAGTVREWAEAIVRQHRPADLLALPAFLQPRAAVSQPHSHPQPQPLTRPAPWSVPPPAAARAPLSAPSPSPVAASLPAQAMAPPVAPVRPVAPGAPGTPASDAERKRCICASCGAKISYPEAKFCWNNARRFGGVQYCRQHQADFV